MLDLPTVEQWLAHDLLIRQILHGHQSVRMQLTEGVNIGCHPRWRIDEAGAEAGEGQVSAKLPDVLLLWRCAEDLPCCERHGEPAVEEGLPGYVLRLQQAADDLGLESCQLGSDVHKGNATLVYCSAGDVSAGVEMCCPCHHRPVGRHEGVHRCAELPEKLLWDRDEGAMICEHGHQHLLGYMGPAEEAEPEAGPAGYAGMQPLEDVYYYYKGGNP